MKDKIKFKEYMTLIGELYDKSISNILKDLYWTTLEKFTDEQCERAFKEIIISSKFFPKPADFIEILQGSKKNQATGRWIEVLNAVKRIGNYQSVKFSDPAIHSVIEVMGGWEQLCMMEMDDEKWKQKEFERLYEIMEGRGNHPKYLPGTCEMQNTLTGYKTEQPIIQIGFDEEIKQIQ